MRLLIVVWGDPSREAGASQGSDNLAGALRQRGHSVRVWGTGSPGPGGRWWDAVAWRRRRLEDHLRRAGPYDFVDCPAIAVTRNVAASAPTIVRSVQPEILYVKEEIRAALREALISPLRAGKGAAVSVWTCGAVLRAWHRARIILCLGEHEHAWMTARFPGFAGKLRVYRLAPSPRDREAFLRIREGRSSVPSVPARFLWIGRWAHHKGIRRLLAFVDARLRADPRATFTLAGTGRPAEGALPLELRDSGRVTWIQLFSRDQLMTLLAQHEIGLFTSAEEGWGLSVSEMLESGMAVYATSVGAVGELKKYFGGSLREFPPPLEMRVARPQDDDIVGYCRDFNWDRIALNYERLLA